MKSAPPAAAKPTCSPSTRCPVRCPRARDLTPPRCVTKSSPRRATSASCRLSTRAAEHPKLLRQINKTTQRGRYEYPQKGKGRLDALPDGAPGPRPHRQRPGEIDG